VKLMALGLVVSLLCGCADDALFTAEDVAKNDFGVAQMGQYEYTQAEQTFADVVASAPGWLDAQVNHAIATLNRQEEGDEITALDMLAAVLVKDPQHLRALYTSGILRLYLGEAETAIELFGQVVGADSRDAYAAYFLGQAHLQLGNYEQASQWLVLASRLDPYLRSAYWASAQALRRVGKTAEAQEMLDVYQRFAPNPAAHLADFAYKRMGPKAEAEAVTVIDVAPIELPSGPLFDDPQTIADVSQGASVTAVDLTGDGQLDLVVSREIGNVVFIGAKNGFQQASNHPLANASSKAALWGDIDDDGMVDVIFCSDKGIEYWRQAPADEWQPTTLGVDASLPCVAGAIFDADHDGDLDVFTAGAEGAELYSNNRDGSFRVLAGELGMRGGAGRQVLVADLDSDRDLDIVVLNDKLPHDVWQNDRTWRYQKFAGLEAFAAADLVAATAADIDADGHIEIVSIQRDGVLTEWDVFEATSRVIANVRAANDSELAVADVNGDSRPEVMIVGAGEVQILDPDSGEVMFARPVADLATAQLLPLTASQGPSLVTVSSRSVDLHLPGTGRHDFMTIAPSGRNESDQMRSNASGIGTRIKLRIAGQWTVMDALDTHSGPGQSLTPLPVGLNGREFADFVALEWSDGVTQSEIELAVGQLHEIPETQRQLASCPVLFVWDGEKYRFVSDVLGVGGLGFFASPGVYGQPRPFEVFLFEQGLLVPKDGRYHIKLTEPMEENAYVDSAMLRIYDVPAGWSMVVDERMATSAPEPSGQPIFYQKQVDPIRAWSNAEDDATDLVLVRDLTAPSPGALDERFVGLLSEPQILTVEFGEPIDLDGATLVADGWVEYGYSQTVFAAWQAGKQYQPVSLEARDGHGQWHMVAKHFGYPAGMPRKMVLPLQHLPRNTRALRLTSNMEIYWDRLQIVLQEDLPGAQVVNVLPVAARVGKPGFASRTTGDQRVPDYDYNKRSPYWDTKFQRGYYTAFGDALALINATDGAMAIIGGGEELHFEFANPAPVLPGFERFIGIEFRGWAKDMDLYTEHGETVGPLPVLPDQTEAAIERRRALHRRYNVRFQEGF